MHRPGWRAALWPLCSALLLVPLPAAAAEGRFIDLTGSWVGYAAIAVFVLAYLLVVGEEFLHLRKSKPVMVAAGIIWALVAAVYAGQGDHETVELAIRNNILEYGELFLFLLAAMTYINTMEERGIFDTLRAWLVSRGFSLRTIFWVTGVLSFFVSAVADNLTTALLMSAVVMAVARDNTRFVVVSCINIVVAANAGGAFSPFGDITTLMVWQKGVVRFTQFFHLFVPALVNWLVPALLMSLSVSRGHPPASQEEARVKCGGYTIVGLFFLTILFAVAGHNYLYMPPVVGMMTGLGVLKFYSYFIRRREQRAAVSETPDPGCLHVVEGQEPFDIFNILARAEWDTLMFFYGVVLCVGGLGTIGYLALASHTMYTGLGPTPANVLVGVLSSVVDNIPVMYAVLTMQPDMSLGQWLLVTMTAGVGGSLLSIGSAAGVALMGQARGVYTFFRHLRWSWAIALGYAASIWVHFLINRALM
jgi:Na+/H+ antiporter NhaD/arsenite permease-like protein